MIASALAVVAIVAPCAIATAVTPDERCAPVQYVLDAHHGPPGAGRLVEDVFDEIEAMSGVRFVPAQRQTSAPVRLAWVLDAGTMAWDRYQLGRATATWGIRGGYATIVAGEVLLRSPIGTEYNEHDPVDWYTVVRHEIGHLMGLPHQADSGAVMHPTQTGGPQTWTLEDRIYLRARGHAAGCRAMGSRAATP